MKFKVKVSEESRRISTVTQTGRGFVTWWGRKWDSVGQDEGVHDRAVLPLQTSYIKMLVEQFKFLMLRGSKSRLIPGHCFQRMYLKETLYA